MTQSNTELAARFVSTLMQLNGILKQMSGCDEPIAHVKFSDRKVWMALAWSMAHVQTQPLTYGTAPDGSLCITVENERIVETARILGIEFRWPA